MFHQFHGLVAAKLRLSAIQPNIHCIFEQHKYNISWGNGCHLISQMTVSTHPQKMKNTPAMNFQMTRRSQCVFRSGAPLRFSLNAMRHICRPDSSRQGMQKSRLKNSSNGHSSSKMSRVSSFLSLCDVGRLFMPKTRQSVAAMAVKKIRS